MDNPSYVPDFTNFTIEEENALCQEGINTDEWEECTEIFKKSCDLMKSDEVILSQRSSSFETMCALELLDPKMDAGCLLTKVNHQAFNLERQVKVGTMKVKDLSSEELLAIFDCSFTSLTMWLEGQQAIQTILTNIFFQKPELIEDYLLKYFIHQFRQLILTINNIISDANFHEMEDINLLSPETIKLLPDRISKPALSSLRKSAETILKKRKSDPLQSALQDRIHLAHSLTNTLSVYLGQEVPLDVFEKNLKQLLPQCDGIIETVHLGSDNDWKTVAGENKFDFPTMNSFCPIINLHMLPESMPKCVLPKSRAKGVEDLKVILKDVVFVMENFNPLSRSKQLGDKHDPILSLLDHLCSWSSDSPCDGALLRRSLLSIYISKHFMTLKNFALKNTFQRVCHSKVCNGISVSKLLEVTPDCGDVLLEGDPQLLGNLYTKEQLQSKYETVFTSLMKELHLDFGEILRVFCVDVSRQHMNLCSTSNLHAFFTTISQFRLIVQYFHGKPPWKSHGSVLTPDEVMHQLASLPSLVSAACHARSILLGLRLHLYLPHEMFSVFAILSQNLFRAMAYYFDLCRSLYLSNWSTSQTSTTATPQWLPFRNETIFCRALHYIFCGLAFMYHGMSKEKRRDDASTDFLIPDPTFYDRRTAFGHRFGHIRGLVVSTFVEYEMMEEIFGDYDCVDEVSIIECYSRAKSSLLEGKSLLSPFVNGVEGLNFPNLFCLPWSPGWSFKQFNSLVSRNAIVASVRASGNFSIKISATIDETFALPIFQLNSS